MSEKLNFRVSAGLKNIIGKELINDKFIAIFELVKNSYDAGASRVDIKFKNFGILLSLLEVTVYVASENFFSLLLFSTINHFPFFLLSKILKFINNITQITIKIQ